MTITLTDGRQVDTGDILFDSRTYAFTLSPDGEDITNLVKNADKRGFNGFDNTVWNDILYQRQYASNHGGALPPAVGSTSTAVNFFEQITTDPLAAPLEAASNFIKKVTATVEGKVATLATVVIIGVVIVALVSSSKSK